LHPLARVYGCADVSRTPGFWAIESVDIFRAIRCSFRQSTEYCRLLSVLIEHEMVGGYALFVATAPVDVPTIWHGAVRILVNQPGDALVLRNAQSRPASNEPLADIDSGGKTQAIAILRGGIQASASDDRKIPHDFGLPRLMRSDSFRRTSAGSFATPAAPSHSLTDWPSPAAARSNAAHQSGGMVRYFRPGNFGFGFGIA